MDNKIIHFRDNEFELDVNVDKNTVWLTQAQISELFEKDRTVITRHINNIFKDEELDRDSVSAKNAHTAIDGKTYNTIFYNLDVIISVGYRVKSARGIKFRRWATEILSKYLTEGYVVNINRLKMENEKLKELQNMISLVHRVSLESDASKSEIMNLLSVVKEYEYALDLLDQYDHKTVSIEGKVSDREVIKVELNEVFIIIDEMKREFDSELFGKEKDSSLSGSIYNIYQTAFGEEVYPSIEEKASNLLYFLVKNHSFIDGNKRIAAAVFMYFVKKNGIYYNKLGHKNLTDESLVALTLLIAESKPEEKEIIVKVIINLIGEK
jgi:prophage maintenance system killer protein/FtsZ-binding cell division protein ZapB